MTLTAWFYGPLLEEKLALESIEHMDIADLKDSLVQKLGMRVSLGSFNVFRAVNSGDAVGSWAKVGARLNIESSLTETFGTSNSMRFFVEPMSSVAGKSSRWKFLLVTVSDCVAYAAKTSGLEPAIATVVAPGKRRCEQAGMCAPKCACAHRRTD